MQIKPLFWNSFGAFSVAKIWLNFEKRVFAKYVQFAEIEEIYEGEKFECCTLTISIPGLFLHRFDNIDSYRRAIRLAEESYETFVKEFLKEDA